MRLIDADKLIYQSHAQHIQPYINKKDIDNAPTVEMAEDCVSREAAVDVVHKYFEKYLKLNDDICLDGIRSLPSVQPQPKRGKWIRVNGDNVCTLWECDQCGCEIYSETEHDRKKFHAWCGMCGAKMDADMKESEDKE